MSITTTHRNLIIGGAALVAAVAMAASADTLAALGRAVGWGYVLSWALPVSVDVLALVAGLAWIAAGTGRSLGRVLTLLTVAVSVLLNALGHLVSTNHLTASPYLVIGVSAVPPLAAALAVHLGATVTTDRTAPSADHGGVDHDDGRASQTSPKDADRGAWADQMPDRERWRTADQPTAPALALADDEHGPSEGSGPVRADQGAPADQTPDREHPQTTDHDTRTTDQPADTAPADQRTNPAPDHEADQVADHDVPAADQQIAAGPQEADSGGRTSNAAGQPAPDPHGPAGHERADHVPGPTEGSGPVSADQGAPADQTPDREHPQTTDHPGDSAPADPRTTPAPDHPDHEADQPLDPSADQVEDGSSGGPRGARTTDHDASAPDPQTKPADQDEVPWEAKVKVARKAALAEGRMTRRAIRPHLRNANITVSNELFSDLQAALYADPTLAHLPRDTRRAR
ncbi:hypothetical protein GCM10010211_20480 [Streptomyces albospinus]|uniref:DUF2637 domain-containing protein n=1 Tax=Streptomyces albospinus TaxID=285515 RepID=A0ABQ2UWM6_9ACTN|nr:DUF2637 domain-containing protein [Streptomyces albospinus]GGU55618.1 hypothetical protein GCM10010211_20480 [Streptomyces albospinus]